MGCAAYDGWLAAGCALGPYFLRTCGLRSRIGRDAAGAHIGERAGAALIDIGSGELSLRGSRPQTARGKSTIDTAADVGHDIAGRERRGFRSVGLWLSTAPHVGEQALGEAAAAGILSAAAAAGILLAIKAAAATAWCQATEQSGECAAALLRGRGWGKIKRTRLRLCELLAA